MNESTKSTVAGLISDLQRKLNHDDPAMAEWLELDSAAVLKAIKTGAMRFPLNKARLLAELLDKEPGETLRLILSEYDSKLLDVIESCLGPLKLSDPEIRIINAIRKVSPGSDLIPITFDRSAIVTLVVQG
ncbi:MAG: hypothetical protein Q8R72_00200 [Hylemonella sp.]|nr:hypothetical protein [Hylemonella sp.]